MLKKAGHILTILLLLFSTTGLTITRHYCGRSLIHTVLYSTPENCCKGHCPGCHNEKISFRITDHFESSQTRLDFSPGTKTHFEQHSLPFVLAFSNAPDVPLFNDAMGDHCIKPSHAKPLSAGCTHAILQVFLF